MATELNGNCTLSLLYAGAQASMLCEPQAVNLVGTPEELGVSNTQWEDWHLLLDLVEVEVFSEMLCPRNDGFFSPTTK